MAQWRCTPQSILMGEDPSTVKLDVLFGVDVEQASEEELQDALCAHQISRKQWRGR
jgi:hypothetical protein